MYDWFEASPKEQILCGVNDMQESTQSGPKKNNHWTESLIITAEHREQSLVRSNRRAPVAPTAKET